MTANLAHNYDPDLALTRGKWVNVRGIMRWQGARPVDEPEPTDPACWCGALRHQGCRGPRGTVVGAHKDRVTPRSCKCGARVTGRQATCDDCLTRPRGRR